MTRRWDKKSTSFLIDILPYPANLPVHVDEILMTENGKTKHYEYKTNVNQLFIDIIAVNLRSE